jgi:copper chaperone CopZ
MEEKPAIARSEAGLHEFVDAEFAVIDLESPSKEKALQDTLKTLPGLESLSISHGKVTVRYEPVRLSRKQIEEAIQRAGFQISEAEAVASSPLTEALSEENKQP